MKERLTATVREVQKTDYEALTRLFEENDRPDVTKHFHPFPLTSETAYQIACTNRSDHYYVAIWNARLLGLCMLRGWDEGYEVPSFGVMVDYRHQGRGLGRLMTEFVISEAGRLGCNKIRLSVNARNVYAVRLYESLGFNEVSREPVLVMGEKDDKILMAKIL